MKTLIVIPVYNGGKHLKDTILHAVNQTEQDIKVLICNNGSTDQTSEVLDVAKKQFPKQIELITRSHPSGMINDWNLAIKDGLNLNPQYLKLLPADDIISPACIELQIKSLEANPELGASFCPKALINEKGRESKYPWTKPSQIFLPKNRVKIIKTPNNWLGEPGSALIPATVWREIGFFNCQFPYYGDLEYWLRINARYPICTIAKNNYWFRLHAGSLTWENNKKAAEEYMELVQAIGGCTQKEISSIRRRAKLIALLRNMHSYIFRN